MRTLRDAAARTHNYNTDDAINVLNIFSISEDVLNIYISSSTSLDIHSQHQYLDVLNIFATSVDILIIFSTSIDTLTIFSTSRLLHRRHEARLRALPQRHGKHEPQRLHHEVPIPKWRERRSTLCVHQRNVPSYRIPVSDTFFFFLSWCRLAFKGRGAPHCSPPTHARHCHAFLPALASSLVNAPRGTSTAIVVLVLACALGLNIYADAITKPDAMVSAAPL